MKKLFITFAATLTLNAIAMDKPQLPIIAHWSFDHDSGIILQDSGPNKLNAKLTSKEKNVKVTTEIGIQGKALKLSAKPLLKYVVQDNKKILNLKPPFTIAMWIKRTGKMPKSMSLLCKKSDSSKTGWDLRYSWAMSNFRVGNGIKALNIYSPKYQIKNDKWYHLAVSNDGKKIKLFINCEIVKEQIFENSAPASNNESVVIGNYNGRSDAYNFIGLLDELYIIGKALSTEELFKLSTP